MLGFYYQFPFDTLVFLFIPWYSSVLVRYEDRCIIPREVKFSYSHFLFSVAQFPRIYLLWLIRYRALHLQMLHLLKKEQYCPSVFNAYFNKVYELKPECINSTFIQSRARVIYSLKTRKIRRKERGRIKDSTKKIVIYCFSRNNTEIPLCSRAAWLSCVHRRRDCFQQISLTQ